jgi:hypothetical protein
MAKVNLDALIPREDLEILSQVNNSPTDLFSSIGITFFQSGLFYPLLKKPDFQRETTEWDKFKICDFLESFSNGDLIPAIILWRSNTGYYFVIDGSHRLSALISWINDDYGDGEISQKFYDGNIPEEQRKIAKETRDLINKKIGSYQNIVQALEQDTNQKHIEIAKGLSAYVIQVQWVRGGVEKAEQSFFKINQQGVALNNTEKKLLESRRKGNCIAARAIKTGGTGHKYWSDFKAENQNEIQALSEEINKSLFTPPLVGVIKSVDLPIAGKIASSQTLPLILDFVNIVNKIPPDFKNDIKDDNNGDDTILFLKKVRKIIWRINSVHASSLGLHPLVYFYTLDGRHRPASFYAAAEFVVELEKEKDKINNFIKVRKYFEEFLLKYCDLSQQINEKYKYAIKSYKYIAYMYLLLIDIFQTDKDIDNVAKQLCENDNFNYLRLQHTPIIKNVASDFNNDKKSAVFIREALENPIKCNICGGLIHRNSITIDHITRKEDGGIGEVDNGQLAHPYCNSTYKN